MLPGRAMISAETRMTVIVVAGAVCGGLLAVAALSFKALDGSHPLADTVLGGASGFLWLAAGVVAHLWRPANRVGLLMVVVSIGWFAEDLQLSRIPVVFSVGLLLTAASSGFLVHLVLAFPTGRLASRLPRLLAAVTYLTVFAMVPLAALFADLGVPPNLLLIRDDPQLVAALWRVINVVGVVVAAGIVTVLVRRWMLARPPTRRVLAPVFVTGMVGVVASLAVPRYARSSRSCVSSPAESTPRSSPRPGCLPRWKHLRRDARSPSS